MKKMMAAGIIIAAWILTGVLATAAELPPLAPMPDNFKNIHIVKPGPSVPKEIAAFLGEWEGVLQGQEPLRRVKFIIYEVSPQKIKFLVGSGDNAIGSQTPGHWSNNESELYFERGKYRFSYRPPGSFAAHFYFEDGSLEGLLSIGPNRPALYYELRKSK